MAVEIVTFRGYTKNTLCGFLTVRLTNIGLEIRDMTLHQKNGSRWIALPARSYQDHGQTKWAYIVKFYDKDKWTQFQKACLKALDTYLADKKNAGEMEGR